MTRLAPPGRDSCGRPAGNITTIPTAGLPNGVLFGWFSHTVEAISARTDMSDVDAMYFMLGFAAGAALLWVVTETIWMRL